MPDPKQPDSSLNSVPDPANGGTQSVSSPRAVDGATAPAPTATLISNASQPGPKKSWLATNWPGLVWVAAGLVAATLLTVLVARGILREVQAIAREAEANAASSGSVPASRQRFDPAVQSAAENLLGQVSAGDAAAAEKVLAEAGTWTGKTQRTARTEQLIAAILNSPTTSERAAGVRASLALDAVPQDEQGFSMMERAVGNPNQRAWALWMVGALGNRGVEPGHAAKVIGAYLIDPGVNVRAAAVDALSLVGTDETIPMLLDRFRHDASPVVQERAACDIAQSGMYTHEQRMQAAATLVEWVDDTSMSAQQRGWTAEALGDISGQNFRLDAAAWRKWYAGTQPGGEQ